MRQPAPDVMVTGPEKPERSEYYPQAPATTIETVDPATAERWLRRNKANRRLRPPVVDRYARDMAAGRWGLTGQSIEFNTEGELIDGQHRLRALVKSGVTLPFTVMWGLPTEAQAYMDVGVKRTLSDQFRILGYENHSVLARGARLALLWTSKQLSLRVESVSDLEIQEFLRGNPSLIDAARFTTTVRCVILPAVVCAATWRFIDLGHYESTVHEFFRDLALMRTDGDGDPKLALLRRLTRAREFHERLKTPQFLYAVVRAFNDCYIEEQLHRMVLPSGRSAMNIPPVILPGGEVWEDDANGAR